MDNEDNSKYSEQALEAITNGDIATIASILKKNVHPDELQDSYGNTALYKIGTSLLVQEEAHFEIFKLLLANGADPNNDTHRPLLHRLCTKKGAFGDEMIKLAISHGGDIHSLDASKNSLLQSAARGGKTWLVEMLLEQGLDANYKNERGENALFCSINAFAGNVETIQLLLANGSHKSDLHQLHDGKLILENILIGNKTEALQFLVSLGVDLNAADKNGDTLIIGSATYGPPAMFQNILELGATIDTILHKVLHRINIRMCSKTLDRNSVEEAFQKLKILHARNYPIAAVEKVYNRHVYSDVLTDYVESVQRRKNLKKYEEDIIIGLLEMGFRHKNEKTFLDYLDKVKNTKVLKYITGII